MPDAKKAIEAAARALCRFHKNLENTQFEGKPMWMSYVPVATVAVEAAVPFLKDG